MCRKHYGSLFGTSLGVASAAFSWLEDTSEIVHYRATAAFERLFCRQLRLYSAGRFGSRRLLERSGRAARR